ISKEDLAAIGDPQYENLTRLALQYSDAAIQGSADLPDEIHKIIKESGKPHLDYQLPEKYIEEYSVFYENVLNP
ncbi:MAG: glycogen synthase, partial [Bacteroidales bacterium]|nr:glycogen synthase [Bacteroidales bacterium]